MPNRIWNVWGMRNSNKNKLELFKIDIIIGWLCSTMDGFGVKNTVIKKVARSCDGNFHSSLKQQSCLYIDLQFHKQIVVGDNMQFADNVHNSLYIAKIDFHKSVNVNYVWFMIVRGKNKRVNICFERKKENSFFSLFLVDSIRFAFVLWKLLVNLLSISSFKTNSTWQRQQQSQQQRWSEKRRNDTDWTFCRLTVMKIEKIFESVCRCVWAAVCLI